MPNAQFPCIRRALPRTAITFLRMILFGTRRHHPHARNPTKMLRRISNHSELLLMFISPAEEEETLSTARKSAETETRIHKRDVDMSP